MGAQGGGDMKVARNTTLEEKGGFQEGSFSPLF